MHLFIYWWGGWKRFSCGLYSFWKTFCGFFKLIWLLNIAIFFKGNALPKKGSICETATSPVTVPMSKTPQPTPPPHPVPNLFSHCMANGRDEWPNWKCEMDLEVAFFALTPSPSRPHHKTGLKGAPSSLSSITVKDTRGSCTDLLPAYAAHCCLTWEQMLIFY